MAELSELKLQIEADIMKIRVDFEHYTCANNPYRGNYSSKIVSMLCLCANCALEL